MIFLAVATVCGVPAPMDPRILSIIDHPFRRVDKYNIVLWWKIRRAVWYTYLFSSMYLFIGRWMGRAFNSSTNQCKRDINQSINQPTNQSINQPTNQSINPYELPSSNKAGNVSLTNQTQLRSAVRGSGTRSISCPTAYRLSAYWKGVANLGQSQ